MANIRAKSGLVVFLGLSILPAVIWFMFRPVGVRFASFSTTVTSLGQLTGLVGMAMFSLVIVLAARLRFMEKYFGGLNRIYLSHHFWGCVALVLLLFHPLLFAARLLPFSVRSAIFFLLPSARNWPNDFGIAALFLLMLLMVFALFIKLPYQAWKLSHKFMGLAYLLAVVHVLAVNGAITASPALRAYMIFLIVLATAAILYRTVFGVWLVKKYEYQVAAVKELSPSVVEVELVSSKPMPEYLPGQFVFISFFAVGLSREYHPFSISSAPSSRSLNLAIKNLGDYTANLKSLTVGSRAHLEGPYGRFSFLLAPNKQQIWIAGGIGVTPFLSMARSLKDHPDYQVELIYCVNHSGEAVFSGELDEIARANPNFRLCNFCSSEQGRINAEAVEKLCGGVLGKDIFICGPAGMMKSLKQQLAELKVPSECIHSEEFTMQ